MTVNKSQGLGFRVGAPKQTQALKVLQNIDMPMRRREVSTVQVALIWFLCTQKANFPTSVFV